MSTTDQLVVLTMILLAPSVPRLNLNEALMMHTIDNMLAETDAFEKYDEFDEMYLELSDRLNGLARTDMVNVWLKYKLNASSLEARFAKGCKALAGILASKRTPGSAAVTLDRLRQFCEDTDIMADIFNNATEV